VRKLFLPLLAALALIAPAPARATVPNPNLSTDCSAKTGFTSTNVTGAGGTNGTRGSFDVQGDDEYGSAGLACRAVTDEEAGISETARGRLTTSAGMTTGDTVNFGMALLAGARNTTVVRLTSSTTGEYLRLRLGTAGGVSVQQALAGSPAVTLAGPVTLANGVWSHVDVTATLDAAGCGAITLRVNGNVKSTNSCIVDAPASPYKYVDFGAISTTASQVVDFDNPYVGANLESGSLYRDQLKRPFDPSALFNTKVPTARGLDPNQTPVAGLTGVLPNVTLSYDKQVPPLNVSTTSGALWTVYKGSYPNFCCTAAFTSPYGDVFHVPDGSAPGGGVLIDDSSKSTNCSPSTTCDDYPTEIYTVGADSAVGDGGPFQLLRLWHACTATTGGPPLGTNTTGGFGCGTSSCPATGLCSENASLQHYNSNGALLTSNSMACNRVPGLSGPATPCKSLGEPETGNTAAGNGIGYRPGLTTLEELRTNIIPHVLRVAVNEAELKTGSWRAPAISYEQSGQNGSNSCQMGCIFRVSPTVSCETRQLDKTDGLSLEAILIQTRATRALCHAAQDYGVMYSDGGGDLSIYMEGIKSADWDTYFIDRVTGYQSYKYIVQHTSGNSNAGLPFGAGDWTLVHAPDAYDSWCGSTC
jgi:hypothetical protein